MLAESLPVSPGLTSVLETFSSLTSTVLLSLSSPKFDTLTLFVSVFPIILSFTFTLYVIIFPVGGIEIFDHIICFPSDEILPPSVILEVSTVIPSGKVSVIVVSFAVEFSLVTFIV